LVFQDDTTHLTDLVNFGLIVITLKVDLLFYSLLSENVMAATNTLIKS